MKRFLSLILVLCIVLAIPLFGCTQVSGATESEGVSESMDSGNQSQESTSDIKNEMKCINLEATFTNNCSGIIRTVSELSAFISDNGIVFGESVDLSAYTEEFFEQKALIFLCQFTDYRSWSFHDLFIEDGTVFLCGAAERIIYYNSAGERLEGVKKAYCFCVEVEKSYVQGATSVSDYSALYEMVEFV